MYIYFLAATRTVPGYFGKGATVAEALANMKKAGARGRKAPALYMVYSSQAFTLDDFGMDDIGQAHAPQHCTWRDMNATA